jgi:acetate kinase
MRILTVNVGSTSVKLERYELEAPPPDVASPPAAGYAAACDADGLEAALAAALREEVDVVAHRFVSEAPLHDAVALRAVECVRRLQPRAAQLTIDDSAFHATMSPAATTYAIPRELTRGGLRRRGYHGLSHEYAAHRGCALAGLDVNRARVVTAHLGGGSSLCAIRDGKSVDTTMGYTPLDGLPMATRCGSVDPGLLLHVLRGGMSVDELDDVLERRSGLLGISGRSGDVRALLAAADDHDARLALDVLAWRLRSAVGAMVAVLGGVDLIVLTGGIGENVAHLRAAAISGAAPAGAAVDDARNASVEGEGCISSGGSRVAAFVVRAREGWQLARLAFSGRSG